MQGESVTWIGKHIWC